MKKILFAGLALLLLGLFLPTTALAVDGLTSTQQVNMTVGGSSLIGITGGTVDLSLTAGATVAGQSLLKNTSNNDTRLRMSSYVTDGGPKNKITAKVTAGSLYKKYTKLYLRLTPPSETGIFINYDGAGGDLKNQGNEEDGFPVDAAIIAGNDLSTNPDILLVDDIGFCWTGTAIDHADAGYTIEYTYASVTGGTPQNAEVTITYTIATDVNHP